MKTKSVFLLGLLLLSGCRDYLVENPTALIVANRFYNTDRDLIEAANSVYGQLASNYQERIPGILELRSDYVQWGPQGDNAAVWQPWELYTYNNLDGNLLTAWSLYYTAINNANALIANAPQAAASPQIRNRTLAEAHFLRAFTYYNLVRLWGSVPLLLTPTSGLNELQPVKRSEDDIYAAIIADLQYAAGETGQNPGLPVSYTGVDNGRATIGAAHALLAEVYLTRRNWVQAAAYAKKVMDSGRYALWPAYNDAFLFANKYASNSAPNGESVFEIQLNHDAAVPSFIMRWTVPRGVILQGIATREGLGRFTVHPRGFRLFSAQDDRRAAIFPSTILNSQGRSIPYTPFRGSAGTSAPDTNNYYTLKYKLTGQNAPNANSSNNWPILRYADVLLIFAEAANEAGGPTPEAYAALNQIRTRARLPNLAAGLSQAAFREAVYEERARELFLEGDRYFDLLRTNRLASELARLGITIRDDQRLLPIPQSEKDLNPNL
jgi:hypothetical protein